MATRGRRPGQRPRCSHCYTMGHTKRTCSYLEPRREAQAAKRKESGKPARRASKCLYCTHMAAFLNWDESRHMAEEAWLHSGAKCPRIEEHRKIDLKRHQMVREQIIESIIKHGFGVGALVVETRDTDRGDIYMVKEIKYDLLAKSADTENYRWNFVNLAPIDLGRLGYTNRKWPSNIGLGEGDNWRDYKLISALLPEDVEKQIPKSFSDYKDLKDLKLYKKRFANARKRSDIPTPQYLRDAEQKRIEDLPTSERLDTI